MKLRNKPRIVQVELARINFSDGYAGRYWTDIDTTDGHNYSCMSYRTFQINGGCLVKITLIDPAELRLLEHLNIQKGDKYYIEELNADSTDS